MIAVVLVGGQGTRLRPLTLDRPKPMLPIAGRPFLAFLLDRLVAAGCSGVVFSCGYLPDPIIAEFGHAYRGMTLSYAVEPEPRDTAGAIRFAAEGRVTEPFLALNGDVLAAFAFADLAAFHHQTGAQASITLIRVDDPTRYGLVLTDPDGAVNAFIEKPTGEQAPPPPHWINAGAYLFDPSVLDLIEPDRPVNIERDVFPRLAASGSLYGWHAHGYWNDIGTPASYLAANRDVLAGAVGYGPIEQTDPDARIGAGAVLNAPYVIHAGACIGEQAVIGPGVTVGSGVMIGRGAHLRDAVLDDNCRVGVDARVEEALIGRRAVIGAGALISSQAVIGAGVTIAANDTIRAERVFAGSRNGA